MGSKLNVEESRSSDQLPQNPEKDPIRSELEALRRRLASVEAALGIHFRNENLSVQVTKQIEAAMEQEVISIGPILPRLSILTFDPVKLEQAWVDRLAVVSL